MRQYEVMYILHPELEEEGLAALTAKFQEVVTAGGGEVTKLDKWGKRRLAYEIDHVHDGYYVVMKFKAEPAVARELDRVLKITDGVIRHMIIREDE
ncbi:30S ribosomal protein S6 [Desulforudis sp. 1088]|uniref:30S ribosomal protein S6 n=1 Tax=unclassified Candidatus Desulforudis TaxID=2635950 RepID=UPI003475949F